MRPAGGRARPASTASRSAVRHRLRVAGAGDRGGGQHRVAAELHRQRGVGGGADAGVEDQRHRHGLAAERDGCGLRMPEAAADRRAQRHHGGAADVLQPARQHGVVGGVGQHDEALGDQLAGGLSSSTPSGSSVRRSPITSSFSQSRLERLARQVRGGDGLARAEAAGGVRQHPGAAARDGVVEAARGVLDPAQGDGHDLGAAGGQRRPRSGRGGGSRPSRAAAASGARVPAMMSGSSCMSASCRRAQHLELRVLVERRRRPRPSAGTTAPSSATAMPRSSAPAPAATTASRTVAPSPSSAVRPFSEHVHGNLRGSKRPRRAPAAPRRGRRRRSRRPASGSSSTPCRNAAGRPDQAVLGSAPIAGRRSAVAGSQPGRRSRPAAARPARGRCAARPRAGRARRAAVTSRSPALLLRRAHDDPPVGPRHQVDGGRAHHAPQRRRMLGARRQASGSGPSPGAAARAGRAARRLAGGVHDDAGRRSSRRRDADAARHRCSAVRPPRTTTPAGRGTPRAAPSRSTAGSAWCSSSSAMPPVTAGPSPAPAAPARRRPASPPGAPLRAERLAHAADGAEVLGPGGHVHRAAAVVAARHARRPPRPRPRRPASAAAANRRAA